MDEIMKAVADVEAAPEIKPRKVPSPKSAKKETSVTGGISIVDKKDKKDKKPKTKKKVVDQGPTEDVDNSEIFRVIGNPQKMSDEPVKPEKKSKKKNKKSKTSKKKFDEEEDFSSGSFSVSSYDESFMQEEEEDVTRSIGSDVGSDFSIESEGDSESEFGEKKNRRTVEKRKEEIMQEKIEMLTRISNMSRMGFTTTRKWSMKDDIDDIRFECYRMTRENNSRKSVKNMQHMLITAATIVEFANSFVNPFNLKLQGFSKNLMLTVSDYDDSLEEIHHKWSGRTAVGPEMTVLFTFVTSAIFHHAGNVMNSPAEQKQEKSKGPDMSSVLGLFSNMIPRPTAPKKTAGPPAETSTTSSSTEPKKTRRPMKGPSSPSFENILPSMHVPS